MLRFKEKFLRCVIEEARGPMHVIGLGIRGEGRFFIHRRALDGGLQYHLTHQGRYINFPRREYAQSLVSALQRYIRVHYYEWQVQFTIYVDITGREREVSAHRLVLKNDDGQLVPTGLAYFKTEEGSGDFYAPLHLASMEALYGVLWSNERVIQHFLRLLASVSPSPDYWCEADRIACIDKFPGGFAAIFDLQEQCRSK